VVSGDIAWSFHIDLVSRFFKPLDTYGTQPLANHNFRDLTGFSETKSLYFDKDKRPQQYLQLRLLRFMFSGNQAF